MVTTPVLTTAADYEVAISQHDVQISSVDHAILMTKSQIKALDAQRARLTEVRAAMVTEAAALKKAPK